MNFWIGHSNTKLYIIFTFFMFGCNDGCTVQQERRGKHIIQEIKISFYYGKQEKKHHLLFLHEYARIWPK